MLGYQLPGVTIREVGTTTTPRPSSTQRVPCFIGKASPYKRERYEAVTRGAIGAVDTLTYGSYGVYDVEEIGTQRGLSDIIVDKDVTVNLTNGEITWLINTETVTVSGGTFGYDLFTSLSTFEEFDTAVNGQAATSGYQELGLTVLSTQDTGLAGGDAYYFKVNGTEYSFILTSGGTLTYTELAENMHNQVKNNGFTVSFVTSDIRVTNNTTGASSTVTLAAGTSGTDLFSSIADFTSFDSAVGGKDATSGYQELGLNIDGATSSGLLASTRYYFRVNGTEYNFKTTTAPTFTEVVTLMHNQISAAGFSVSLTGGDIRVTRTTTGSSSIVTLASGVKKSPVANQMTFTITPQLIFERTPGYVQVTTSISGHTYTFSVANDINPGDTSITLYGTDAQLIEIDVGTSLVVTTIPRVAEGGTYYVTYRYNRPEDDYKYKEFTNYQDVIDDLGDNVPDNPLVMIANLALEWYSVPKIAVVQVAATAQNSDYVAALQKCKHRNVQTLGVLNSSGTVRNATIAHVNERNLPENARWRMYYTGPAELTPLGDIDQANTVAGIAYSLKNEAVVFVNATRAKYYYKDPDTGVDTYTTVDGAFIGAALAAYHDSFSYPCQTLISHVLPGLELFADDYDDYFTDDKLKIAGTASACVLGLGSDNAIVVRDDLTTDNTSIEKNNINIITAKHYIAKDVMIQMDRTFTGRLITNRIEYKDTIKKYLTDLFRTYHAAKIIEQIGALDVELPTTRRDTVKIKYSYYAVYTHKYTEGEYTLAV